MHAAANFGTIVFALIAAGLWLAASLARVKGEMRPPAVRMSPGDIDAGGILIVATTTLQSRLNALAALASAIGALCQAASAIS